MIFYFKGLHVSINDIELSDGLFISAVFFSKVVKQLPQLILRVARICKFDVWDGRSNYCLEPDISEIQVGHTKHGDNLG